jgi:hypothetical protein
MEREARERRGLKSNTSKKGSDTKVTPLLNPTRVNVFTQRHPTMKGKRRGSTKTPPRRRMAPKSVTVIAPDKPAIAFARASDNHPTTTTP